MFNFFRRFFSRNDYFQGRKDCINELILWHTHQMEVERSIPHDNPDDNILAGERCYTHRFSREHLIYMKTS